MNTEQARAIVKETFPQAFDKSRFQQLAVNLLNHIDESKAKSWNSTDIKEAFKVHVKGYERLGTYTSPDKEKLDVLIVHLTAESKLERARTAIRNFVADHLKTGDGKDAALVAFISPTEKQWRFSYVKMEYAAVEKEDGKVGVQAKLTPARRSSYIVGENESCHTAQSRFLDLLQDTENHPTLAQIEDAFSVEAVTKEFFEQYKELFLDLKDELDSLAKKDKIIGAEFADKNVSTADFAKKLMGQIVFLYFLQKKGWLGVPKGKDWGDGPHNFLRQLFAGKFGGYKNFFNDILEPLFYDTLATDRGHDAWCKIFSCRIPFLNGGLFEPVAGYDWQKTNILIPNSLFSNTKTTSAGDAGTGILDVFDRYNFTVNEAEPLEKEVAIDPEMLGKVFENLLEVKERKSKGSFYTPREIVHYMCQESLINYLDTAVNSGTETVGTERRKQGLFGDEKAEQTLLTTTVRKELIPRADIETFIHSGDQASYYEAARVEGTSYQRKLPKTIETYAKLLDDKLADIAVCDPAIGSGAFPVGMMQEIVRARSSLTPYFNDVKERTAYHFKRHAIQNCIYGVDIDPGAVEIAKLRLWLSLVVDEDDVKQIKPLPNLDYKIVVGNSLLAVEKTLFNKELSERLEELKPKFFDATDRKVKSGYKREIDRIIQELTSGKEDFDFEIYFSEVFHAKNGFDIVIANPPYGADISAGDLGKIKLRIRDTGNSNSAALFIDFGKNKISHARGTVTFIVPKSLLFSEDWFSLVKSMAGETSKLVDVEKAFEKVLLEQVVFVLERQRKTETYLARKFLNSRFVRETIIPNDSVALFEAWICDVTKDEFHLGKKIKRNSERLADFVVCFRGFPIQRVIKEKGHYPVIGGINLMRYGIEGVKGYLTKSDFDTLGSKVDRLLQPKLMAQNLVAHIQNPTPHIQIIAALDKSGEIVNLDTVTNIVPKSQKYSPQFLLAILNSTMVSWYAYKFIFCSAIRTMHFDKYYVGKIPIPAVPIEKQKSVERLVDRISSTKERDAEADVSKLELELDELVYALYGLTSEEISTVRGVSK